MWSHSTHVLVISIHTSKLYVTDTSLSFNLIEVTDAQFTVSITDTSTCLDISGVQYVIRVVGEKFETVVSDTPVPTTDIPGCSTEDFVLARYNADDVQIGETFIITTFTYDGEN